MKPINTKDNIWVCGFQTNPDLFKFRDEICQLPCLFIGKTDDITEEMAKQWVHEGLLTCNFKNYITRYNQFETAIESLKSACHYPLIIVYKK